MGSFFDDWKYMITSAQSASTRHFYLMLAICIPIFIIAGVAGIIFGIILKKAIVLGLSVAILLVAIVTLVWMAVSK